MTQEKRDKTGSQAFRQTIGEGSGKPRKSGGEEPYRGETWSGKYLIRNEPDQGQTQRHQPVMDRLHHLSAQPGQIGRGSAVVAEFFSVGDIQLCTNSNS